jgi:hypothetical protein
MVVAFIALLVAGGGATFAAIPDSGDAEIHGCYANKGGALRVIDAEAGATCNNRETALPWNQQGQPGTNGSDAASAVIGRTGGAFGFDEYWAAPSGTSVVTTGAASQTHLSPNATMVAQDLAVRAVTDNSSLTAESLTFDLRDVTTTASPGTTLLTCTMNLPADSSLVVRTCDSGSSTASVAPKSDLALSINTSVGAGANGDVEADDIRFGWRATTP